VASLKKEVFAFYSMDTKVGTISKTQKGARVPAR
jgi:hypothetical protein